MNKHAFLIIFFISCILSCSRCKEECDDPTNPDCPNYIPPTPVDPCAGKSEVSADFQIWQRAASVGSDYDSLRLVIQNVGWGSSPIVLHAAEDNANYKWILGIDTIYTRDYEFVINETYVNTDIQVKLIVNKEPDVNCFPLDNGIDTLIKTIHVIDFCNASVFNQWRGAWDSNPTDTFTISIMRWDDPNLWGDDCYLTKIAGHHQDINDTTSISIKGGTDEYLHFESCFGPSFAPRGVLYVSDDHQDVEIHYTMLLNNITPFEGGDVNYIFRGHRVN